MLAGNEAIEADFHRAFVEGTRPQTCASFHQSDGSGGLRSPRQRVSHCRSYIHRLPLGYAWRCCGERNRRSALIYKKAAPACAAHIYDIRSGVLHEIPCQDERTTCATFKAAGCVERGIAITKRHDAAHDRISEVLRKQFTQCEVQLAIAVEIGQQSACCGISG